LFIHVRDLGKAVDWYTQTLGFDLNWRNDEGGYACIDGRVLPITLVKVQEEDEFIPSGRAPFNFYALDIDEVYRNLKDKGIEMGDIENLYNTRWFWFKDPDGNRLEVCGYSMQ
jgi:catechol 2,3-dioxygenase-like lactoylglutathione lyase family enzyme